MMMSSRSTPKTTWLRLALATVGAFASAAVFGAAVAALLSIDGAGARSPLQNPFEATRSIR